MIEELRKSRKKTKYQKKVLKLAMYAGEIMLTSGGEIYRVEKTINKICKSCGVEYVNTFVTPTGIFAAIDNGDSDDILHSYIFRIHSIDTDLNKVYLVNKFAWEFTTSDMTVEDGIKALHKISQKNVYSASSRIIAAAFVAALFSLTAGGTLSDSIIAFFVGALSYSIYRLLNRYKVNFFICSMCCIAIATLFALIFACIIPNASYSTIVIGAMVLFVPGVALVNSIRDFLSGDMSSGLARLAEVALTGISLAVGAGTMLKIWLYFGGIIS